MTISNFSSYRVWGLRVFPTCLLVAFSAAMARAGDPPNRAPFDYLAVAWNEPSLLQGKLQLMWAIPPWQFEGPVRDIGIHATMRFANGLIYVVSPTLNRIDVFDPDELQNVASYQLDAQCQPRDIAVVDAETAYVSCAGVASLVRLDLDSGAMANSVDLSIFADSDGNPDITLC